VRVGLTPNELARTLGISGLQFRNWLRERKAAGHPLLIGHVKRQHYEFSGEEAEQLLSEYRGEQIVAQAASRQPAPRPRAASRRPSTFDVPHPSEDPGRRVEAGWMGETVMTLEDLLRPALLDHDHKFPSVQVGYTVST
jgi:hypothetical protein